MPAETQEAREWGSDFALALETFRHLRGRIENWSVPSEQMLEQTSRIVAMKRNMPSKLRKFPAAKQRSLDELLEKSSEGTISGNERKRLEQLVEEAEELMVANARLLARFTEAESAIYPTVPVTVWVTPTHTGR